MHHGKEYKEDVEDTHSWHRARWRTLGELGFQAWHGLCFPYDGEAVGDGPHLHSFNLNNR